MSESVTIEITVKNIVFQADTGTFSVFRGENPEVGDHFHRLPGAGALCGRAGSRLAGIWGDHPPVRPAVPGPELGSRPAQGGGRPGADAGQRSAQGSGPGHGPADRGPVRGGHPGGAGKIPGTAPGGQRHRQEKGGSHHHFLRGTPGKPGAGVFSWKATGSAGILPPGSRPSTAARR